MASTCQDGDCMNGGICNGNGNGTACICKFGFQNRGDFLLVDGVCQVDVAAIRLLWMLSAVVGIFSFAFHVRNFARSRRMKQEETSRQKKNSSNMSKKTQKEVSPYWALAYDISVILIGAIKTIDEERFLGDDPVVSLLSGLNLSMFWFHFLDYVLFFVDSVEIVVDMKEESTSRLLRLRRPFKVIFTMVVCIASTQIFIFSLVELNRKGLYSFLFTMVMVCCLITTGAVFDTSSKTILIQAIGAKLKEIEGVAAGNGSVNAKLCRLRRHLKNLQRRIAFLSGLDVVFLLLVFHPALNAFRSYVFPIQNIVGNIAILTINIVSKQHGKRPTRGIGTSAASSGIQSSKIVPIKNEIVA